MHVKDINSCKHVVPCSFFGGVSVMYVDLQSDVATSCTAAGYQWHARDVWFDLALITCSILDNDADCSSIDRDKQTIFEN
jgi:hypothetical protein